MNEDRDLLAVGHTAFDYIIQLDKFPEPNSSTAIRRMRNLHGGAAANVALVGSNLGLRTSLVSAVGGDFEGSEYRRLLEASGIDISSMIVVSSETTPTAFVMTDADHNQISYFYWGAAGHFRESDIPQRAIESARAVHLATGDPSFNCRCGEFARSLGKIISFDPGQDLHMYSRSQLKRAVGVCDILFGNHHEIDRICSRLEVDIGGLRDIGPDVVVKTYGRDGSVIYADDVMEIDAIPREAVDPTGAGDSYRAGFMRAYLAGADLMNCGRFASAVASFIVEEEGTQTNIPDLETALRRFERHWGYEPPI
ncbi:carbohydrate kinase family protein [Methanothermobacter sp.]|uniref:carbohydrate kinase family protein n=1 Tax=Methanothermobacter sp. TaxID=1884223 RepID=UPI003C7929C1